MDFIDIIGGIIFIVGFIAGTALLVMSIMTFIEKISHHHTFEKIEWFDGHQTQIRYICTTCGKVKKIK